MNDKIIREVDCYPNEDKVKDCPDGGVYGPDDPTFDQSKTNDPCANNPRDLPCPTEEPCYPWQFTNFDSEVCNIEGYVEESIVIASAKVNVHKMLGIHEQKKLVDEVGVGDAISNGDHPNFPAKNAFDQYDTEWRSLQLGKDVVRKAYIGYDFGPIRLDNGRLRYAIETFVKKNIATIRFKQGCDSKNRVTRIRLERSYDGEKWYGVSAIKIPDCEGLITVHFKATAPARYWRIRPLEFNGGENDYWSVRALELSEHEKTNVRNIQDKIFLENRDRHYSKEAILTKGYYTPVEYSAFLHKMGFNSPFNPDQFVFEFSFRHIIRLIGRPLVIGDILELPSEIFYNVNLEGKKKYLEVTNVAWASTGYTPHWVPTLLRVIAEPAMASRETQDIFGDLTENYDDVGTASTNDADRRGKNYQDVHDVDDTIASEANTQVPQAGQDFANKQKLSDELRDWIEDDLNGYDPDRLDRKRYMWGVSALPPNGEDYTEGDEFPDNPSDGDYHRLTYNSVDRNLSPNLYRYSKPKKRWLFLESDERYQWKETKPTLTDFINPAGEDKDFRTDVDEVEDKLEGKSGDSET